MADNYFSVAARPASPKERLESWLQNPSDSNTYHKEKLATFVRISQEVLGSTFHLHGTVTSDQITEKMIEDNVTILSDHFRRSVSDPDELSETLTQIRTAQHRLCCYAAHQSLHVMQRAKNPLWASDIDRLADQAKRLFAKARNCSAETEARKAKLETDHAEMIAKAKKQSGIHSVALDMVSIKRDGMSLEPKQRDALVKRSKENLVVLAEGETTERARKNLENLRSDIELSFALTFLPASAKLAQVYKC